MQSDSDSSSDTRLSELGHQSSYKRRLSVFHVVGIGLADVAPTMSVVFYAAAAFAVAGSFVITGSVFLSIIVVFTAACMAELAAMYPLSGGIYAMVSRVLPAPLRWMTLANYLFVGVAVPGSVIVGISEFIIGETGLFPDSSIPAWVVTLVVIALVLVISVTHVEIGAWITVAIVVGEILVMAVLSVAVLRHWNNNPVDLILHPTFSDGSSLQPVTFAVMLVALVPLYNVVAGYDGVLGFAEEMRGSPRDFAKAIMLTAMMTGVLVVIPILAIAIAAPNLQEFYDADIPALQVLQATMGSGITNLVNVAAIFAIFNSALVILMYYSRVLHNTAVEQVWPQVVNKALGKINRFGTPAVCVTILTVISMTLALTADLDFLLIISGSATASMFFSVGLAAFVARFNRADAPRPFRMWLWPVPPIIVMVVTGIALVKQDTEYLIVWLGVLVFALVMWGLSYLWQRDAGQEDPETQPPSRDIAQTRAEKTQNIDKGAN